MSLLDRLPSVSATLTRRLAVANLIAQVGIMVTGVTVRVTGSGLGCPNWPQCFPGSMVPVSHAEVAALHQWVEFGNRLLTFVLVVIAGLLLLAALATRPRRRRLVGLAWVMPVGIVAQAVIGGITVWVDLAWYSVSIHFMVSAVLVWVSVALVRAVDEDDVPALPRVPAPLRRLAGVSSAVLAALLVAGTLVTAAGPHAGDPETPRLGLGVPAMAQLHADLLFAYLGLLVGFGFALRAVGASKAVERRFLLLVGVVLAQGALGGVQYAIGVPEVLVVLHVLGAGLTTAAAANVWFGLFERRAGVAASTPDTPATAAA